eukprot:TRINITY_DN1304_c0_g1_i6.p1 TRINITY_DN1304_c0_g1~~TRINITY_DN1304_c0_g1_i6.p1  ORF type:complete len:994 (+),score=307.14 TRINITY_DN1304_c0_g1_i6:44-2983(+)
MLRLRGADINKVARQLARYLTERANEFPALDTLTERHLGINEVDAQVMLRDVKAASMDEFINSVIPTSIYKQVELPDEADVPGEKAWLEIIQQIMDKNLLKKQCIGMGYYEAKLPNVILRNLIESPGWYTPYTPYQAEIAQGRLESLMNYQQMVIDLTGLPLANASLLDEATAVGEAVGLSQAHFKNKRKKVFFDKNMHPASIAVATTRAEGFGVEVIVGDVFTADLSDPSLALICCQYPDTYGSISQYKSLFAEAKENKVLSCCASDLLALTQLTPPGELGADICCGSTQRFGVPLGFGGPHAAFFATQQAHARITPGRIIGVSRDKDGNSVFRMALQTREQHIKREKATSNICTAQALLANVASMYAVWHGPEGLKKISSDVHLKTKVVAFGLQQAGCKIMSAHYFDTLHVEVQDAKDFVLKCEEQGVNIRYVDETHVGISLDECTEQKHIVGILLAAGLDAEAIDIAELKKQAEGLKAIPADLVRSSRFLEHPIFNSYHSETELMRYIYKLEKKDMGLNTSMIPLGSCTMKLNAAVEMLPITWPSIASLHPFVPVHQAEGYVEMLKDLEDRLSIITGMDATCIQPNSGSQGEYTGLRIIKAYHESRGEGHRDVCIIPSSAHGTNPASAAMCGLKIAVVKCTPEGAIDVDDLKVTLHEKYPGRVAAIMITYPSTFGIFDENIKEITSMVHSEGGQIYIDGANMNAQMGLAFPGEYGGDVLHLNLHKTFSIPHGGGGPGMGPICMKKHLAPFMPDTASPGIPCGGDQPMGQVSQSPYGSAGVLPISWTYIRCMGYKGLRESSKIALLNANYMMTKLGAQYQILYAGLQGRCGHEFIVDLRPFKKTAGVEVEDVAKRLIDYNFHSPTMSFPVAGTLMIEPTESESKRELDRFIDAMLMIREEIRKIENGTYSPTDNPLKNAPHTMNSVISWDYSYSIEEAVYPVPSLRYNKAWPTCSRINSAFGDRNFVCTCPPIEDYI